MIINFRFSNATELVQTIGRGNRNPLCNQSIVSHIFVDNDTTRVLTQMLKNDFVNQDVEAVQKLCDGLNGFVLSAMATKPETVACGTNLTCAATFNNTVHRLAEMIG